MSPTEDFWDEAAVLVLCAVRLAEAALAGHESGRHWFNGAGGAKARYELAGLAIAMVAVHRIEEDEDEDGDDDDDSDDAVAQIARRIAPGIAPAGTEGLSEGSEFDFVLYDRVTEYLRLYTDAVKEGAREDKLERWASRLKLLLDASTIPGPVRRQFTLVVGDFFEEMPRKLAVHRCVARIIAPAVLATLSNARAEGGDLCGMKEAVLAPLIKKNYTATLQRMEDRASEGRPSGLLRRLMRRLKR